MRSKIFIMISFLLGGMIFASPPTPAFACSCEEIKFDTAYERSAVIFTGRVTELKSNSLKLGDDIAKSRTISFQVDAVYKGAAAKQLKVYDYGHTASCGYPFKQGSAYLVYAYEKDGELFTSLCSRNAKLESSANGDLEKLKQLHPTAATAVNDSTAASGQTTTREFIPGTAAIQITGTVSIILLGILIFWYLRGRKQL